MFQTAERARTTRARFKDFRKQIIVIGKRGELALQIVAAGREDLRQIMGRQAIALGKDDVEADHDNAVLNEPVDEFRQNRARPGPLAKLAQTLVVDIHDRNRIVRYRSRTRLLELIEEKIAGDFQRRRVEEAQEDKTRKGGDARQAGLRTISS